MAYGRITQKQSEILEYIKSQILNKGYPPSVRDICSAVNLKSTSSVHAHLESLEKNGYIRRDPTKPRTIEIIDDNFNIGIYNGDQVVVEKCNTAENGEIIVALLDDSATVKRFYKENGHIRLQPENDFMDPIIVDDCMILGKVIGLMRWDIS